MQPLKLNFALVCNYAVIDIDGLINILGAFDYIIGDNLATPYPQFFFVANFKVNETAIYSGDIKLVKSKDGSQLGITKQFNWGERKSGTTFGMLSRAENIKFSDFGMYQFVVTINNIEIAVVPFEVKRKQ